MLGPSGNVLATVIIALLGASCSNPSLPTPASNTCLERAVFGPAAFYAHLQLHSLLVELGSPVNAGQPIGRSGHCGTPIADLHFGVCRTWPAADGNDVAVNFRNADGPLDSRGGLRRGVVYTALPY